MAGRVLMPTGPASPVSPDSLTSDDSPIRQRSSFWMSVNEASDNVEKKLLHGEMNFDDDSVDFVMVFPRQIEPAEVLDPLERAKEVFEELDECAEPFAKLRCGAVSNEEYHEIMRSEIVSRLSSSGFSLSSFVSIDQDEVFLKIGLPRSGNVIKQIAENHFYWMPFRRKAYRDFTPDAQKGSYRFDKYGCPLNDDGDSVPAYQPYTVDNAEFHQDFTDIDGKRIGLQRISELMNVSKLQEQGLLLFWFVAAEYSQMKKLGEAFWGYDRLFEVPKVKDANVIREYFGEQVAFFFQWNAMLTRSLSGIAVFIFVVVLLDHFWLHSSVSLRGMFRFFFMTLVIIWAQLFKRRFKTMSARAAQRWGMKEHDTRSGHARPDFDPSLDRTKTLALRKVFVYLIFLLFCGSFVFLVLLCQAIKPGWVRATATVAIIKVGYPLWCQLSKFLVRLQNHRTEQGYNNALAFLLSGVKMFTTLFPFLHQAFIVPFEKVCVTSGWEELATELYCKAGACDWPQLKSVDGAVSSFSLENITDIFLHTNGAFSQKEGNQYCVFDCYPTQCETVSKSWHNQHDEHLDCTTNCWDMLKYDFEMLYVAHLVSTIVALVIPRVLSEIAFRMELWNVQSRSAMAGTASLGGTFLEKQAKQHLHASYTFGSWGGSPVGDFLEMMTSFLLFACFGALYPPLAVFAFLCHCVEYRLFIRRMVFINARPFPQGADGIGIWEGVMSFCIGVAVVVNVGIAVEFLDPLRDFDAFTRLAIFTVVEHALFFIMQAVSVLEPDDVNSIEVYNNKFIEWIRAKQHLEVDASELKNCDEVDIGLGDPLSCDDSASSEFEESSPL